MQISIREFGDSVVLYLHGQFVEAEDAESLREAIAGQASRGRQEFILDLADVEHLGSVGIGALVSGLEQLRKVGASLKLARLSPHVEKVLCVTQVVKLFESHDGEAAQAAPGGADFAGQYVTDAAGKPTAQRLPKRSHDRTEVSVELLSRPGADSEASKRVEMILNSVELDQHARFDIEVAVQEAVLNAIEHGNRSDPYKRVTIECVAYGDRIEITVTDEGEGFDLDAMASDPTAEGSLTQQRGRGLYLIHSLMDQVHHNPAGNQIRMIKFRKQPAPCAV